MGRRRRSLLGTRPLVAKGPDPVVDSRAGSVDTSAPVADADAPSSEPISEESGGAERTAAPTEAEAPEAEAEPEAPEPESPESELTEVDLGLDGDADEGDFDFALPSDGLDSALDAPDVPKLAALTDEPTGRHPVDVPDEADSALEPIGGYGTAAEFDTSSYQPIDAPHAQDLFESAPYGDLTDEPAPTEEVPAGVMEDVSQTYNAPYSVPAPPPIPGIIDRFTPPPIERTEMGSRRKASERPGYLDETPGMSADRLHALPAPARSPTRSEPLTERRGPSMGLLLLLGAGGLAAAGALALVLALVLVTGARTSSDGVDPIREPVEAGVQVRDNMTQVPALIGAEPVADDPVNVDPGTGDPPPDGATDAPDGTTGGATTGEGSEPAPVAAPRPPPVPLPAAVREQPKPAASTKGTLKIRSNRRVLVYVNDQAIGYTPQDYKVEPGDYRVAAMVPGQPKTRQTRQATVGDSGNTAPVDFNF